MYLILITVRHVYRSPSNTSLGVQQYMFSPSRIDNCPARDVKVY